MREVGANRKLLVGGVAALVAVAAVGYTVHAVRAVLDDAQGTRSDLEIVKARLAPDPEATSRDNPNRRSPVHPPPAASCAPEAFEALRLAGDGLVDNGSSPAAIGLLEQALARDPRCVGAARLLVQQWPLARLKEALAAWRATADASPGDAAAQLLAGYGLRALGDGAGYRRYLERASAANPDQPLLHVAWSFYWTTFANPRSKADQLRELEEEVRVTGDLASVAGLARELGGLWDDDAALRWCDRYAAEQPGPGSYPIAKDCVTSALRAGDAERERAWTERMLAARTVEVGAACRRADLAGLYVDACRAADALAEADRAAAAGCGFAASTARRIALVQLGRFAEAAAAPEGGRYWGSAERLWQATALALVGDGPAAIAVARAANDADDQGTAAMGMPAGERAIRSATILAGLLEGGATAEALLPLAACDSASSEATRLARAAGGYLEVLALDEARTRLDRALALDPADGEAWGARVYQLSLEQRLDAAVEEGERALASGPEGAGVRDAGLHANLGYVHQQLGRCDRAVPHYQAARAALPLRESNLHNLAQCLDALGREDEARVVWSLLPGGPPSRTPWPWIAALVLGVPALYLGGKLALIRLAPGRFGHLKFP